MTSPINGLGTTVTAVPSTTLVDFIISEEGYRSRPYKDATVWAIGYGRTIPGSSSDSAAPRLGTDEPFERKWMTSRLDSDRSSLSARFPGLNTHQLTYLTAVAYNIGLPAVIRNIRPGLIAYTNAALTSSMSLFNKSGRPLSINPVLVARRGREIKTFLKE